MQKLSTTLVLVLIGLLAITGATAAQTLLLNGDEGASQACVEGSDQNAREAGGLPCSESNQKISTPITFNENVLINGNNRIGLGTTNPDRAYHMAGRNALFRADRDVDTTAFLITRTEQGNLNNIWKSYVFGVNASGVNNGEFLINDLGTATFGVGNGRVFTIDNGGQVKVNALCFGGQFGSDCRSSWPSGGSGGGSISSVNGTNGLTSTNNGGNVTIQPDYNQVQRRQTNPCSGGQFLLGINSDGSPNCSTPSGGGGTGNFTSINNTGNLNMNVTGGLAAQITANQNTGGLDMTTTGNQMRYFTDTNGDGPPAIFTHIWFDGGVTNNNIKMAILIPGVGQSGEIRSRYAFNGPTNAFDLAEGFWKSQAGIEPGDVIRVDPRAPNAVLLADREADSAVIGVVSTTPGLIMGGHAFSVEDLAAAWGQEVTGLFESERVELEAAALGSNAILQRRSLELESLGGRSVSSRASATPAEEVEKRADYETARFALEQDLEQAMLDVFFQRHIAKIALAGRVPVKVDGSYGVIRAGDLLVSSSTPGHAMRAGDNPAPGTVVGKALESHDGGTGRIMMLVMMR